MSGNSFTVSLRNRMSSGVSLHFEFSQDFGSLAGLRTDIEDSIEKTCPNP